MQTIEFEAIGTQWHIEISDVDLKSNILEIVNDFESKYSRFKSDSLISKLNNVVGEFEIDSEFFEILEIYKRFYDATNGAFTPFVGIRLNDIGYDQDYSFEKKDFRAIPKFDDTIEIKKTEKRINLIIKEKVEWDIGGIGKGFLIDKLATYLTDQEVENFVIDGGGDIYQSSKFKDQKSELKVGLEHPTDFSKVIGVVNLKSGFSICGSSKNRRSWKNESHIVNLDHEKYTEKILSTWVVSNTATISDSAATCLFLCDPEELKKSFPEIEFLILYEDFKVIGSSGFEVELF